MTTTDCKSITTITCETFYDCCKVYSSTDTCVSCYNDSTDDKCTKFCGNAQDYCTWDSTKNSYEYIAGQGDPPCYCKN